jgi:hypothetical protein
MVSSFYWLKDLLIHFLVNYSNPSHHWFGITQHYLLFRCEMIKRAKLKKEKEFIEE